MRVSDVSSFRFRFAVDQPGAAAMAAAAGSPALSASGGVSLPVFEVGDDPAWICRAVLGVAAGRRSDPFAQLLAAALAF